MLKEILYYGKIKKILGATICFEDGSIHRGVIETDLLSEGDTVGVDQHGRWWALVKKVRDDST